MAEFDEFDDREPQVIDPDLPMVGREDDDWPDWAIGMHKDDYLVEVRSLRQMVKRQRITRDIWRARRKLLGVRFVASWVEYYVEDIRNRQCGDGDKWALFGCLNLLRTRDQRMVCTIIHEPENIGGLAKRETWHICPTCWDKHGKQIMEC